MNVVLTNMVLLLCTSCWHKIKILNKAISTIRTVLFVFECVAFVLKWSKTG